MADFADTRVPRRGTGSALGIAMAALSMAGGSVPVNVNGVPISVKVDRNLSPADVVAGSLLRLGKRGSRWYAAGIVGLAIIDVVNKAIDAIPDPKPAFVAGRFVVRPVETATYRASVGWRTDTTDAFQGDQSGGGRFTGCAFYGSVPTALAGATVTKAVVKLQRLPGGPFASAAPTLKLVQESAKPGGAPTLSGSLAGPSLRPGDEAELDIGTTWGQSLVDGTFGGLAINVAADTPYLRLAGRDAWPAAFVVVLDWRRDG